MAERFKALVLKTRGRNERSVGSNPTLPAIFAIFFFYAQIKNFMRNWVQRPTQAGNQIQVGKNTKLEEWSSGLRQRFAKA